MTSQNPYPSGKTDTILDIPGLQVGQAQDLVALTGLTVLLAPDGAVAGADIRGGGSGTREIQLTDPRTATDLVHAIVLSGGSAFGLDAAGGVMAWLEERGIGFDTGVARVPLVPQAILFDLGLGDSKVRPDHAMAQEACDHASADGQALAQGNYGAGCGACIGKLRQGRGAMKSGIGSASVVLEGGFAVGAIVAVNALGDVYEDGRIIAGMLELPEAEASQAAGAVGAAKAGAVGAAEAGASQAAAGAAKAGAAPAPAPAPAPATAPAPAPVFADAATGTNAVAAAPVFADSSRCLLQMGALSFASLSEPAPAPGTNTTIGIIATNGAFTKAQCGKIASMGHNGMARAIRPVHTTMDGDLLFSISAGDMPMSVDIAGEMAAIAVERAIIKAVKAAAPAGGLPSWQSYHPPADRPHE